MCTVLRAFITSRVDYCNAVLYGVPAKVTRRLQALHAAARLITGVRQHISPRHCVTRYIGCQCQCLNAFCSTSKSPWWSLTVFVVKDRDILVPIHTVGARARLGSADHGNMVVPRSCTVRFGQRSFRSSAPSVWNDLPSELKNDDTSTQGFKSCLKSWH